MPTNAEPKEGDLRIWHIPNPPRRPFNRLVKSLEEAKDVLNILADYDNYIGDPLIWANAQGLEKFEGGEWLEWHNEDDFDIAQVLREEWDERHSDAAQLVPSDG